MKKALQYLVIIALFTFCGIILTNRETYREVFQQIGQNLHIIPKPCAQPIRYAIGSIDPGFGIDEAILEKTAYEAEHLWDDSVGKNLFQYDPNAQFKINLVYDNRQERTQESQKLENNLSTLESSHEELMKKYDSLSAAYKKKLDAYNKAVTDYEKKLNKYNDEVDSWNAKGGAPEDIYNDLKKEKKDLQETFTKLETQRKDINNLIGQSNDLAEKDKAVVTNYNSNLDTYQSKYGQTSQFDKGVYNGQEINVYQFNEITDLRLTIAHEFGHALGIDHLQSPESIMYYLMGDQDLDSPHLSSEDMAALKNVCRLR